ncbi:hypothetical protein BGX24_007225 [Mortierella sp. AD032]|nr:hypothetical protein BGX24_007225 [Mortierella sp. AD032]
MFSQLAFWKTYITPDRYSFAHIPDLTGKVAIVTGANQGLGYITMVALAGRGAHVFIACRDLKRARKAIEAAHVEIRQKYPYKKTPARIEVLELDLIDMNKAKESAKEFLKKGLPLHILVNNAGLQVAVPFELSPDGNESRFAVNHMGHFVFTTTLLDRLKDSQPSRIINISSIAHEAFPPSVGVDFSTLNNESSTTDLSRYGRSKLANVLFTKALARRLANERVYVNAVHPEPSALARDKELQEKLWAFSEDLVREKVKALSQLAWWKTYFTPKRYSYDHIPDLAGKVAIVTGANTGLGYATAFALAANAEDAIERAKAEINTKYPCAPASPQLAFLELDLNDTNKTHQAAQEFLKKELPLHILVNTSGIMNSLFGLSADGIEAQFAVNHVGHFVFTTALLDRIKESQPSRIVILSYMGHELLPTSMNGIYFDTLNPEGDYSSINRYSRSKLANIVFGKALARRLVHEKVWINVAHPRLVATEIGPNSKDMMDSVGYKVGRLLNAVMGVLRRRGL